MEEQPAERAERRFRTLLIGTATVLVAVLLLPFATPFFAAAVFAGVLHPLQRRLAHAFGNRPHVAAGVLTAAVTIAIVVPVAWMGQAVFAEASKLQQWFVQTAHEEGTEGLVAPVPEPLRASALSLLNMLPESVLAPLAEEGADHGSAPASQPVAGGLAPASAPEPEQPTAGASGFGQAAGAVARAFAVLTHSLVALGVLLVALFFLLAQGEQLVTYLLRLAPLTPSNSRAMLTSFRQVSVAVLLSTFVTALIQTAMACIGYLVAGVPSLALMLFVTFLMAFVPVIGATGVVTASGLVLWISGEVGFGIFLAAWGLIAVGSIDNFVKPLLVRGRTTLPTGVVFFSMLCGLAAFGPVGMVAGPLIVTFFTAVTSIPAQEQAA